MCFKQGHKPPISGTAQNSTYASGDDTSIHRGWSIVLTTVGIAMKSPYPAAGVSP